MAQRARVAGSGRPHPLAWLKGHGAVIGRVLIVALALVACAVPPVFVNNVIGYLPLLALLIALVVCFAYLQVLKRELTFSEDSMVPSCERGSEIAFVVNFANRSPLVFVRLELTLYISDLFGGTDAEFSSLMTLMPFERRDFSFDAAFDHIGTYAAGVKRIVISDPLGLFFHTIVNEQRHEVEVLPRLFDVSRVDLTVVSSEESQKAFQALASDDMDYAGVREYEWGDPIKLIHWKLSSRLSNGHYLTRLFETFNDPGISIIIDTTAPAYASEDLMFVYDGIVESALSVNEYARNAGLDSVITFVDKYGETERLRVLGLAEFTELTSVLPRICVKDDDEAVELLRRESGLIHGRDNVAYCTAHVNEQVVSALIELRNRKRNPMLLLTVPPTLEEEELAAFVRPLRRLDAAQIVYYVISSAADLSGEAR